MEDTILLLGVGRQGRRILDLLVERGAPSLHIFDCNTAVLAACRGAYGDRITIVSTNPATLDEAARVAFLAQYPYMIDALPAEQSFAILSSAAKTRTKTVSVSFLEEDFMALESAARTHGACIVPDCGVAPGLSHLLAGHAVRQLGGADRVVMKLGAMPMVPQAPFFHNITWSAEDLASEYIRPAKVRDHGTMKAVDPFDTIVSEDVLGLALESFITDGARSFLTSYPDVPNVEERTLRYPGHLDYMKGLKAAGALTGETLERQFGSLPLDDQFVMQIVADKGSQRITHAYRMPYDAERKISALVQAVAITAVETWQLMHDGVIDQSGVCPLERLATDAVYERLVAAHRATGAAIEVTSG